MGSARFEPLRTPRRRRRTVPTARRAHPHVRTLFALVDQHQMAISDLAAKPGLEAATIWQWARSNSPNLTSLEAALGVLGYRLVPTIANSGVANDAKS